MALGDATTTVLLLLVLFQVKHLLADYFLQTPRMLDGREHYMHLGRAEHAGIHAFGSIVVFLLVGAPTMFIVVLVVAEWIVHFHIDWIKAWYSTRKRQTPDQAGFWHAFGADQACHQLTYLAMAWAWAVYAA